MAAKKKGKKKKKGRIIVKLIPKKAKELGEKIKFFYTVYKNPRMEGGVNGKIELMKYNPVTNQHELFIEGKVK